MSKSGEAPAPAELAADTASSPGRLRKTGRGLLVAGGITVAGALAFFGLHDDGQPDPVEKTDHIVTPRSNVRLDLDGAEKAAAGVLVAGGLLMAAGVGVGLEAAFRAVAEEASVRPPSIEG